MRLTRLFCTPCNEDTLRGDFGICLACQTPLTTSKRWVDEYARKCGQNGNRNRNRYVPAGRTVIPEWAK